MTFTFCEIYFIGVERFVLSVGNICFIGVVVVVVFAAAAAIRVK